MTELIFFEKIQPNPYQLNSGQLPPKSLAGFCQHPHQQTAQIPPTRYVGELDELLFGRRLFEVYKLLNLKYSNSNVECSGSWHTCYLSNDCRFRKWAKML